MSIGIVKGRTASAIAKGIGNPVLIVRAQAEMDTWCHIRFWEISEESEAKRPSVQVGDPFTEKLLEASLEALQTGAVGMQDMGAAGIACSSVKWRQGNENEYKLEFSSCTWAGMTAYEMLLSESQNVCSLMAQKQDVIDV